MKHILVVLPATYFIPNETSLARGGIYQIWPIDEQNTFILYPHGKHFYTRMTKWTQSYAEMSQNITTNLKTSLASFKRNQDEIIQVLLR